MLPRLSCDLFQSFKLETKSKRSLKPFAKLYSMSHHWNYFQHIQHFSFFLSNFSNKVLLMDEGTSINLHFQIFEIRIECENDIFNCFQFNNFKWNGWHASSFRSNNSWIAIQFIVILEWKMSVCKKWFVVRKRKWQWQQQQQQQ